MSSQAPAGVRPEPGPAHVPAARFALGMLMPICISIAVGVLLVALANTAAREGRSWKEIAFWAGIALIVAPCASRLCSQSASRSERIGLVLSLGLGLYLTKILYSPGAVPFSDEFVHLASTQADLASGHLFSFNPLLPEAARYPGLGAITSALVRLTGLPVSIAGYLVIGAARLVLMLALFLVIERLSASSRVAGLACLLYAANPNFLYWSAQFSYESLALPLAVFALYLTIERARMGRSTGLNLRMGEPLLVSMLAGLVVLAVVITHHLSSYFLAGVLAIWSIVALWRRRGGASSEYAPVGLAVCAAVAIGLWLTFAASVTDEYLGGIAGSTGEGLVKFLQGTGGTRALFTSGAEVSPLWERLLSIAAVVLILVGLVIGAYRIWRVRHQRPQLLPLLALAIVYPLLLPLRFIGSATEAANRSTEFLFLGLGGVLAFAAFGLTPALPAGADLPLDPSPPHVWRAFRANLRKVTIVGIATIVVLGGVAVSWQYSERLPQNQASPAVPYELGAKAIDADRWAATELGPGHRFASDFLDHLGLATYGEQRPLWAPVDGASAWQILLPTRVEGQVRAAIARGHVQYVMIERRLSNGIPASGFYFDKGEPQAGSRRRPISPAILGKFDSTPGVDRLYDNGEQQIYKVAALR